MSTYSDHDQRLLDQQSGAALDREAKSSNQHFGLTREQLQKLAGETVREHALHLVAVLHEGDYDGMNLVALLEIFAGKLAEASAPDIPAAPALGICCYGGRRTRSQCGSCAAWKPVETNGDAILRNLVEWGKERSLHQTPIGHIVQRAERYLGAVKTSADSAP